jgi:hypothetical protein
MNTNSSFTVLFQTFDLLRNCVTGCIFSGCLLVLLAGCASSGVVKSASPTFASAPVTHDLAVVETSSSVTNANAQIKLLNAMIISGLQQSGKFGRVSGNKIETSAASGIKIIADVKEFYGVSDSARMLIGGLAGRARVLIQVTVSDMKSGNQIETFEAEGKSSGGTAFSGTTDQAVERAAEQVVAEVVKISQ